MKKSSKSFIKSHNLVNRIYDMLFYFETIKNTNNAENTKKYFNKKLNDVCYVETLAKYFEKKLKKYQDIADIKCNLIDIIYDLDLLKQYLA